MNIWFLILTIFFIIIAVAMILIILVQRTQGGGLAGAFGGAGGAGAETVFGGRVGDALTWATVFAFLMYMGLAIALNLVESKPLPPGPAATPAAGVSSNPETVTPTIPVGPGAPSGTTTTPPPITTDPPSLPDSFPNTTNPGGGGSE